MKRLIILMFFSAAAVLSGCSMHHPQNAQEFRTAAVASSMASIETIEVKRPYKKVVKTFKKYTDKCLAKAYEITSCVNGACSTSVQTYTPTLISTRAGTELHLQLDMSNMMNVSTVSEIPENGMYVLVLDAVPVGKKTTKIELYSGKWGYSGIKKAVKGWASGEVKGCPDLTRT